MSHALLVLAAFALVASVGAGVALHAADTDAHTVMTVDGKVTSVDWNPKWDVSVEFTLQTSGANAATYNVELGPPWWWADHDAPTIKVNDTVKVQGELDGQSIEAFTIWVNGGPAIVLREPGMPPWAQERSGQTGEHNETEDAGEVD